MQAEDDKSDTYYYCELVRQLFCKMKDLRAVFLFFLGCFIFKLTYFRILHAAGAEAAAGVSLIWLYWALYIVVIKRLKCSVTNRFER